MTDIIDQANDRAQQFLEYAMKNRKPDVAPCPCGSCYNCDEVVNGELLFCDADCRDDWQLRNRRG